MSPSDSEATRLAILETKVESLLVGHKDVLASVAKLSDSVDKISKDGIRMQVYVKALWPTLSIALTVIGLLVGRFVL